MKRTKKPLAVLMSIVLLLCAMPLMQASAESEYYKSGPWEYTVEDSEATIEGFYPEDDLYGKVSVPSTLGGYPVTGIEWISCYNGEIDLYIPASITHFAGDPYDRHLGGGIVSITVDENNSSFSSEDGVLFNKDKTELIRFPQESEKTSYTIPDGVVTINSYAFEACKLLKSVTIPNSVTSIGNYAFAWFYGLENITIPGSVATIGDSAFLGCSKLTHITLPESLQYIGEYAFAWCDSIESIILPEKLKAIGDFAFYYCDTLSKITVDESNVYFSNDEYGVLFNKDKTSLVFCPCNFETYTIPNGVTEICNYAFAGCEKLKNVIIPDSVTAIGAAAFEDCNKLINITVDGNNQYYSSEDGVLFSKDKTVLVEFPFGKKATSYTVPDGVTTIGDYAFDDCPLARVYLPESIKSIGYLAFGRTNITKIYIPANIEVLDYRAFDGCYNLEYIYFGGSRTQWDRILSETNPDRNYDGNYDIDNACKYFNYELQTASGSCGTNATWYYDGIDTLTISGTGAMASYPEGKNAPWNNLAYDIERLEIEEGITKIDGFYNLSCLETIILPESLKCFESCVFCWDYDDAKEIIYKGMPEQWENIYFGTHDSDGCFCYDVDGAIYIDNEDFVIDSINLSAATTTVKYGETVSVFVDVPTSDNGWNYFLPVGTHLCWYGSDDEFFISSIYTDCEYYCDMTSENDGTTTITVCLEGEDGWTIYNDDGEPIEASITLTSKVGVIELISYFFRELFNILFGWLMF